VRDEGGKREGRKWIGGEVNRERRVVAMIFPRGTVSSLISL